MLRSGIPPEYPKAPGKGIKKSGAPDEGVPIESAILPRNAVKEHFPFPKETVDDLMQSADFQ